MNVAFPFRIDARGRTETATEDEHVKHLIEQLLFTSPGERPNRPTFGTPISRIVFEPNSRELASATEFTIQGALQQWLEDIVKVEAVEVECREATLEVTVMYVLRRNQERRVAQFTKGI